MFLLFSVLYCFSVFLSLSLLSKDFLKCLLVKPSGLLYKKYRSEDFKKKVVENFPLITDIYQISNSSAENEEKKEIG